MTRYSPEFLRNLRATGGTPPPLKPIVARRQPTMPPPPTDERPMGARTAAYGANLREQIKAGTMTNAQAQALHNANVKQEMAKPTQAPVPSVGLIDNRIGPGFGKPREPSTPPNRNLLGALRPGVTPPTQSTSQQPRELPTQTGFQRSQQPGYEGPLKQPVKTPPPTVAPRTPVDPDFAIDRPSMGGVKPGMSLAPTQTGSMAASGPPTTPAAAMRMKKGGKVSKPVKKMAKGGSTASSRGDGCAVRGKTKGTMR